MTKANVHDIARYIKNRLPNAGKVQLMKYVYFSFAAHLHWHGERLFDSAFYAWEMGPVCKELHDNPATQAHLNRITATQQASIDRILRMYDQLSGKALSTLTHRQQPWREARKGVATTRSDRQITPEQIAKYYAETHELEFAEMRLQMAECIHHAMNSTEFFRSWKRDISTGANTK
jgi:uncharacterized phage-associated protein